MSQARGTGMGLVIFLRPHSFETISIDSLFAPFRWIDFGRWNKDVLMHMDADELAIRMDAS